MFANHHQVNILVSTAFRWQRQQQHMPCMFLTDHTIYFVEISIKLAEFTSKRKIFLPIVSKASNLSQHFQKTLSPDLLTIPIRSTRSLSLSLSLQAVSTGLGITRHVNCGRLQVYSGRSAHTRGVCTCSASVGN